MDDRYQEIEQMSPNDTNDHRHAVQTAMERFMSWPGYSIIHHAMQVHNTMQFFLAGGAIRDIFLQRKRPPKDFDIFLAGEGCEAGFERIQKHGRIVSGPFGSPRWYPTDEPCCYADLICIPRFFNGLWRCGDIIDVLNQFDFTGNAIAIDLRTEALYDPQNGIRDMRLRIMKMIRFDYPDEPIRPGSSLSRQAVLWFRVLHYSVLLNLSIEPFTLRWLFKHQYLECQHKTFVDSFFEPCTGYREPLEKYPLQS